MRITAQKSRPDDSSEDIPYKIPHIHPSKPIDGKKPDIVRAAKPGQKPSSNTLVELINDFKHFKEQQKPKESDPEPAKLADPEPPKPPRRPVPHFSPESAAKLAVPPSNAKFSPERDRTGSNVKSDQEEYRVLDFANCELKPLKRASGRMYDPMAPKPAPLNTAAPGSLLKVWTGALFYNKQSIPAEMFSIDNIAAFQAIPQINWRLEVTGRTKVDELEGYLKGSVSATGTRNIVTGWVEPGKGGEFAFKSLSRELAEKDRAAVIRYDPGLTLYITVLTESFKATLNTLRVNVLQQIDRAVALSLSEREKLACFLVFKKSFAGPAGLNPSVVVRAEGVDSRDDARKLSPVSEEEEDGDSQLVQQIISKLQNGEPLAAEDLTQLKSLLLKNPSPEVSCLIASINARLEQEAPRECSENSVTEFLAQQYSAAKGRTQQVDPRFVCRFS